MRIVRLAALFGSLVLLTATLVLVVERRNDERDDQIARARGTADAALVSTDAVLAATTGAAVAAIDTLPPLPDADELAASAELLASVSPPGQACVASVAAAACTDEDLLGREVVGTLLRDADAVDGGVVVGVDGSTDSIIAVRRAFPPGSTDGVDPLIAVVALPVEAVMSPASLAVAGRRDADLTVRAFDAGGVDRRTEPTVVEGLLFVTDRVSSPFAVGSIDVITAVDGELGIFDDLPGFFAVLIGLGSVLLVLAAVTFLADRRRLEKQAATDELTGLANRREFERLGAEAVDLAARFGTGLTVMMVDLNGFKQINDSMGHQYGDLVLTGVADRLVAAVRETDVVGRWGGDEFVILLPGLDAATAIRSSAERITATLSSSPVVGDTVMRASIGAAAYPRHGGDLDALMRTADAAMYAAKTSGVDHRVADAELARRANGVDDAEPDGALVVTDDYVGPDRRAPFAPPAGERVHESLVGPIGAPVPGAGSETEPG